jgi:hypothetical protein
MRPCDFDRDAVDRSFCCSVRNVDELRVSDMATCEAGRNGRETLEEDAYKDGSLGTGGMYEDMSEMILVRQ